MDDFIDMFLSGDSLSQIFTHACNSTIGFVTDPITDTLCTMIKTPVNITLTTKGLMMFRESPGIILPYLQMNKQQKNMITEFLSDQNPHNVNISRFQNSVHVTFKCEKHKDVHVDVSEVLLCACTKLMEETQKETKTPEELYLKRRKGLRICNIILQRIKSVVHIKHAVFVNLYSNIRDRFPDVFNTNIQKDQPQKTSKLECYPNE